MKRFVTVMVALAMAMALVTQCRNKKPEPPKPHADGPTELARPEIPDSTTYGIALECGMGTINILTAEGDTLLMDKDDEKGYGEIYGYVAEGDTFAVTTRKESEGPVVVKAYNMTLLKRFDNGFSVRNGLLVHNGNDTVDIVSLNHDSLVVKSQAAKQRKVFRSKP